MAVIAFTGGGSAGHVIPGLAVMEEVCARGGFTPVWIGSRNGIERAILSDMAPDVEYRSVPVGKLRRYVSVRNAIDAAKLPFGVLAAMWHIRRWKPAALFSKGGFVSVPPVLAAWLLRVPVITHESDVDPGLATRINARFARYICVAYERTASAFGQAYSERIIVTGNPVRRDLGRGDPGEAETRFSLDPGKPLLLVLGGSIGSASINRMIDEQLEQLCRVANVVHHRGAGHPAPREHSGYTWAEFFTDEYIHLLARADLVVARAGAGTVWELAASGTPAVLVPLGAGASRGDQLRNAELYAEGGGAVVLQEDTLTSERLFEMISGLLGNEAERDRMKDAALRFAGDGAATRIADLLSERAGSRVNS